MSSPVSTTASGGASLAENAASGPTASSDSASPSSARANPRSLDSEGSSESKESEVEEARQSNFFRKERSALLVRRRLAASRSERLSARTPVARQVRSNDVGFGRAFPDAHRQARVSHLREVSPGAARAEPEDGRRVRAYGPLHCEFPHGHRIQENHPAVPRPRRLPRPRVLSLFTP